MASPQATQNALGNIANAVALGAGATSAQYAINALTDFEVQLQMDILPGATVAATNGVTLNVYRIFGSGTTNTDTSTVTQKAVGSLVASTSQSTSIALPTGNYMVSCTNADATNGVIFTLTTTVITGVA